MAAIGGAIGFLDVVIGLDPRTDRLRADLEHPTHPATKGDCPTLIRVRLPVGRDNHVRDQEPPLPQVVVHEWLNKQLTDISPILIARKRPQLPAQYPNRPPAGLSECHRDGYQLRYGLHCVPIPLSGRFRKHRLCPVNKQRAQLVPEITAKDEQANQQQQVADNGIGKLVTKVTRDQVDRIRRKPS